MEASMFKNNFNKLLIILSLFLTVFNLGCKVNETEPRKTRYFLVGEATPQHGDSFILPLTSENDIAAALEIMKQDLSTRKKIVVAKIEKGDLRVNMRTKICWIKENVFGRGVSQNF